MSAHKQLKYQQGTILLAAFLLGLMAEMEVSAHEIQSKEKSATATKNTAAEEPAPTFKIASPTSRAIQKYTGLTWIAERGIGLSTSLAAKFALGGHPHIQVKAYSLTDCFSGKFKKISVDLKDCTYKKVPFGQIHASTIMPVQFRAFKTKKGAPGVVAPVMVAVRGEVNEADVSNALQSPKVASSLNFLRLELPGLGDQHLQVLEPKVKLENGKVKINTWLITANAPKDTGVKIDISAEPKLDTDRFIVLKDTKVESADIVEPDKFSVFSEDLLNPLLDFGKFDRHTHAFRLNQLNVQEQKVNFEGKLLLAPKPVQPSH